MSSIVLSGDTSGSVTVSVPAVSGSNTVTIPAVTGTVMVSSNMPAFSAKKSASQTGISNFTYTKVTFETEVFDTNNNFASSRFTPTVAGYYQINANFDMGSTITYGYGYIAKNGSILNYGSGGSAAAAAEWLTAISGLVYCNGSTDYIEIYVYMNSSSNIIYNGGDSFSGVLVRGA